MAHGVSDHRPQILPGSGVVISVLQRLFQEMLCSSMTRMGLFPRVRSYMSLRRQYPPDLSHCITESLQKSCREAQLREVMDILRAADECRFYSMHESEFLGIFSRLNRTIDDELVRPDQFPALFGSTVPRVRAKSYDMRKRNRKRSPILGGFMQQALTRLIWVCGFGFIECRDLYATAQMVRAKIEAFPGYGTRNFARPSMLTLTSSQREGGLEIICSSRLF